MELFERLCQNCGGDLQAIDENHYKCRFCGSVYEKETVADYADEMRRLFDEIKLEAISNARRNLYEAVNAEYVSSARVHECCVILKQLLPDDAQANFFDVATGSNAKQLTRAIRKLKAEKDVTFAESVIRFLVRSLQTEYQLELNNLIARTFEHSDPVKYEYYCTLLSNEAVKVDTGVYETKLPREVFIAYSSKDMENVSELTETLEAQGLKCFVAARNLRHGKGAVENYNAALEEAMDHCRAIVFVSSTNSRSFNCDALTIELPYLQKRDLENAPAEYRNNYKTIPQQYKKPRVEYRIGESVAGNVADTISNEIFDGYERAYTPEEVAARVMKQLVAAPKTETKTEKAPETKKVKYCVKCFKECDAEDKFCSECGECQFTKDLNNYDLEYKLNFDGNSYSVVGIGKCISKEIVIPAKYNGLKVTRISKGAFKNCTTFTKLNISNGVVSIGDNAFRDCRFLLSISLPDSVKSIGASAFWGCSNLASASLPNKIKNIGNSMFSHCTKLENVDLPDKLQSIGNAAFFECSSLTNISLPSSLKSIGSSAFSECIKLTNITIPNQVTTIDAFAFKSCKSLTVIRIPNSVINFGKDAFYGSGIKTIYYLGNQSSWKKILPVEDELGLNDGVEVIYNHIDNSSALLNPHPTIVNNPNLNLEFVINNEGKGYSVKSIGECTDRNIVIPAEYDGKPVTSIGYAAFKYCKNLISVFIPDSVVVVGDHAFNGCSNLENINLPDSIIRIGIYAFKNCKSLKKVNIPKNVEKIPSHTFFGCSSLTDITIPSNINTIGKHSFRCCISLKSIIIQPGKIESIGNCAFRECSAFTSIIIPESVKKLGVSIFADCSALEEVIFVLPLGWQISDSGLFSKIPERILADPQKAAEALKTKYADVAIERV